jgi:DNA-binding beta-propeller fold protein YncE
MNRTLALALAAVATCLITLPAGAQFHRLESVAPLKSAAPDWDYLSFDPARGNLFIAARGDGMIVYDVNAKEVIGTLEETKGANASVQVPEFDRVYTVNLDGTSTVFRLSDLKKLDKIKLGEDADAAFYDPATKQVAFMRGDSGEITYVDAKTGQVVSRLPMPSKKLEASAADGQGNMFTASRDRNSVFKVDVAGHKVIAEYPAQCDEANGMAIDRANKRLFVGCRGAKPVLVVMDTDSGKVVAKLGIGRGNDGVIYDPETRKVYTSSGVDGNLVIYNQIDANTYKLAEATTTRPYARTMALDPKTKKLYLVTAEGTVDPSKKVNTAPAPFYPNRYFPDTFTLLTYSPK